MRGSTLLVRQFAACAGCTLSVRAVRCLCGALLAGGAQFARALSLRGALRDVAPGALYGSAGLRWLVERCLQLNLVGQIEVISVR